MHNDHRSHNQRRSYDRASQGDRNAQGGARQNRGPRAGGKSGDFRKGGKPGGFRKDSKPGSFRKDDRGPRDGKPGDFRKGGKSGGYRKGGKPGGFRKGGKPGGFRKDDRGPRDEQRSGADRKDFRARDGKPTGGSAPRKDFGPRRDSREAGHPREVFIDGKLMAAHDIAFTATDVPGTVLYVAADGTYLGAIVIADTVKPDAARAIADLRAAGVKKTVMLTGDRTPVARAVAAELGIDEVHAELLPQDKVAEVEALLAQTERDTNGKGKLAFVGDGINDAPVLTRADIGIAMGAMGSDAAIEAADIVLMNDDPDDIARAIHLARRTMGIVWQNIVFALGVKFAVLVLAAFGIANMWMAVFADVGVAVIAILNAMRAMNVKRYLD